MRALNILIYGFVFLALGSFFAWVIFQMAWHSESLYRVAKLGAGFGAVLAALLIGLLITRAGAGARRLGRPRH